MAALKQIPEFYITQFGTNWEALAQQQMSRLKQYATITTVDGKERTFNLRGPLEMQKVTQRAGRTRHTDQAFDKRWIRPFPYDLATLLDENDEKYLAQSVLPNSDEISDHSMAYNRACDRVIIDGLIGGAAYGPTGALVATVPGSQQIAVDYVKNGGTPANSGLTLAKLIRAKDIFGKNEIKKQNGEEFILGHTQQQLTDLLNDCEQVSSDRYNEVKALIEGEVDYFMGFRFVSLELLPKDNSDIRSCVAYAKSGIKFSDDGHQVHIDVLPTDSHAIQIRTVANLGSLRTEEKKVVQIFCDESP